MTILYGQADYTARLKEYGKVLKPGEQFLIFSFAIENGNPRKRRFDFHEYDGRLADLSKGTEIVIAFPKEYHEQLCRKFRKMGFYNLVLYTSELDNRLKREYFKANKDFKMIYDLPETHGAKDIKLRIYMAKSELDCTVSLKEPDRNTYRYVVPIQVGAALTDKKICETTDNVGDNISAKNRRYSEMTAFYWMWKNDKTADFLGICHYRRLWDNLDKIVEKLKTTDIDAVLPLPTLCEHSVYEDDFPRYIPEVWKPMMKVLEKRSPEYYEAADIIYGGKRFYASNMCILKRKVLEDLCNWMFPIVTDIENIVGDIDDSYFNRYAGFCTERLITLYFLYNKQNWRIAHADKVFIG